MTIMAAQTIDRVRQALEQLGTDCPIEEVVGLYPDLTWNQVFLSIDYLSRTGEVRISLDQNRTYRVQATHGTRDENPYVSIA